MLPRILFLITDLDLGGSPLVVRDLAIGLRDTHGFETAVCSLAPITPMRGGGGQVARMLEEKSIPVHTLDAGSPRQFLPALRRYRQLLKTFRPDIVYSVLVHANFMATLGKLSQIHKHVLIQSIHTLQPTPRWHWILQGFLLPHADAVVVPAPAILDRLARFGNFQNARVIPNGVDVPRFALAKSLKIDFGATSEVTLLHQDSPEGSKKCSNLAPLVVGYIGRFDPVKRLDLLVKSMAFLPENAHLVLVGYGSEQRNLESIATGLGLLGNGPPRVHFVGPTVHPERWYKSFDIHALPSPVEGFGLTLAESLAAGIPVAAFRTPATEAMVRPGVDGALATELSPRALALAITEVTALLRTGRYAPQASQAWIAEQYSLDALITRHANFLRKFAGI